MLTSQDNATETEQRRKPKRSPIERVIRWGTWSYHFWREIARWCYEQSLHNPAVVDATLGFPAHSELIQNYNAIRQETLEIALPGRLPANHEIMEKQRTLYEFDRKTSGMLALRGYGYNHPANQDLMPTLKSFLKRHPDVVHAAISLFPQGKYCAHTKIRSKECGVFNFRCTWKCRRTKQHLVSL
jgi:aspartate beta-hydroxylase